MENLGDIGVSFASCDSVDDLKGLLGDIKATIPPDQQALDRIVLIVPNELRKKLGWPKDRTPQPAIFKHDLVFRPPV
jgi:hypothetical protein